MFWKASSFSNGSAVDGILDKQNFTVEELLNEDDLVQVSLYMINMPLLRSVQTTARSYTCAAK